MVLATLPVAYHYFQAKQFGWGQQFAYDGFNITLTAIVFVMAPRLSGRVGDSHPRLCLQQ